MSAIPLMRIAGTGAGATDPLWLSVADAAERTGYSTGHLRRLCNDEWLAAGKARTYGDRWEILESAILPIEKQNAADQIDRDIRRLSEANRKELFFRQSVMQRYQIIRDAAAATGKTIKEQEADFISRLEIEGTPVSRRTLYGWRDRFTADGLRGLFDGRWELANPSSPSDRDDDDFLSIARDYWLNHNGPAKSEAWRWATQAATERGIVPRSLTVTIRYLNAIPLSVQTFKRKGEDKANAKVYPYIQRSYISMASNEEWVGDHHQMDVWVNCGTEHQPDYRRPWLTAWMDMRSRLITGWCLYAHDPNQNSILSALRGGVSEYGVPSRFYIDNGKDYDSYTLQGQTKMQRHKGKITLDAKHIGGIFGALGCTARHAWAYHGQSKPIERWFGTLERSFGKEWPTYCGSNTMDRPEDCFDKMRAGHAPMFDEFISHLAIWIESRYHQQAHLCEDHDGQSPSHVFADSWLGTSKRTATPDLLDILLQKMTRPAKVGRNGVNFMGLTYCLPVDNWIQWQGKEVYLRIDERRINSVTVWTPQDRFICCAESADKIPANATEQILRAAIREKKSRIKAVKTYYEKGRSSGESVADIATRSALEQKLAAQKKQQQPDPEGGPAAIRPVRSDIEGQVKEVQRQVNRLRPAVGMESSASETVIEQRSRFSYTPRDEAQSESVTASPFRYHGGDDHE